MSAEKPHADNSGVLFAQKAKWTSEKPGRPSSMGEVTIVCPTCNFRMRKRVSGWEQGGYQSLAFSEPKQEEIKP
jgi:hypothetical protein